MQTIPFLKVARACDVLRYITHKCMKGTNLYSTFSGGPCHLYANALSWDFLVWRMVNNSSWNRVLWKLQGAPKLLCLNFHAHPHNEILWQFTRKADVTFDLDALGKLKNMFSGKPWIFAALCGNLRTAAVYELRGLWLLKFMAVLKLFKVRDRTHWLKSALKSQVGVVLFLFPAADCLRRSDKNQSIPMSPDGILCPDYTTGRSGSQPDVPWRSIIPRAFTASQPWFPIKTFK